jgi:2-haloacid dehalogenase
MPVLRSFDFDLITFDCYGTLIDWESGIFSVFKPVLARHGKSLPEADLLELYGEFEAEAETGEYQNYRDVLRSVVRRFGQRLNFTPAIEEVEALPASVPDWRPWPDTVAALQRLSRRYPLAIISNIDDDLFAHTHAYLRTEFVSITTAQQAACYKPGLKIFCQALEKARLAPARVLHVGQSLYHDVLPAQSLGLATVWVNRPSARAGVGAVRKARAMPDLEVASLAALAEKAGC